MIKTGREENPKILILDDEQAVLESLSDLFRKQYFVFATDDVAEAFDVLQKNDVAVVITDQRMPGMSGTEFLAKTINISPDTVRVLITAYSDIEAVIQAVNKGKIFYYVSKPWDSEKLEDLVQTITGQYLLVSQNRQLMKRLEEVSHAFTAASEQLSELETKGSTLERDNKILRDSLDNINNAYWHIDKISEVLPICMGCGKVRTEEKEWEDLHTFFKKHTGFLSHGFCPECAVKHLKRH